MTSDWTEIDSSIFTEKQFFFFILFDQALTLIYIHFVFSFLIVHSTPIFNICGGDLLALSLAMFPYK